MCDKCVQLDRKIEHYSRLSTWITDQKTIEEIRFFIEKLRAQKAALHPGATSIARVNTLGLRLLTLDFARDAIRTKGAFCCLYQQNRASLRVS